MPTIEERLQALEQKVEMLSRFLPAVEQKKPEIPKSDNLFGALGSFDIPDIPSLDHPVVQNAAPENPLRDFFSLPSLHTHDDIKAPEEKVVDEIDEGPAVTWTGKAAIEGMPHIMRKLEIIWGFKECHNFFNQLIVQEPPSDQRQSRQGFSIDVMSELLFLQRLAEIVSPAHHQQEAWSVGKRS